MIAMPMIVPINKKTALKKVNFSLGSTPFKPSQNPLFMSEKLKAKANIRMKMQAILIRKGTYNKGRNKNDRSKIYRIAWKTIG